MMGQPLSYSEAEFYGFWLLVKSNTVNLSDFPIYR